MTIKPAEMFSVRKMKAALTILSKYPDDVDASGWAVTVNRQ
jgi:hypothetical protein